MPDFTAWENVLMPRRIAGNITRQDNDLAQELLELMGLAHRLKHLPSELSGGERQRLALARALIHRPSLLLADEPSGNLDADNTRILHKLLKDVQRQFHLTIVIATHDMSLANLAVKRYLMKDCQIMPDAGNSHG
jgi:lipoprotein-releasing system ATP-binding protein